MDTINKVSKIKTIAFIAFLIAASSVFAQMQGTFESGVKWTFLPNGTLVISGEGPMPRSFPAAVPPWNPVKDRITAVIIEDGVTTLTNSAFNGSAMLSSVTIGRGVTTITSGAFSRTGIVSIIIPEQIAVIENNAFNEATKLETVYYNAVNCADIVTSYTGPPFDSNKTPALKTVVIGDAVKRIPANIFSDVNALTSLTIGKGVTEIGDRAFRRCNNLTGIFIPGNVQTIGAFAFEGCEGMTTITIDNGVDKILHSAFSGTRITEIIIPESVATIRTSSFGSSSRLRTVYFNATNCENIDVNSPFQDSNILEKIIFSDNVRQIPAHIAKNLTGLESVTIGSRVNQIGDFAFQGCINLEAIINKAAKPQALRNAMFFQGVDRTFCTLFVPAASVSAYKGANIWKDFRKIEAL